MVNRASDDICQIRLDFVTFNIAPPNNTGECLTDFFLVTGGSAVPQICGTNDGQHRKFHFIPSQMLDIKGSSWLPAQKRAVVTRAVMIPALDPSPEPDFNSFWDFWKF